jgi:ketosteroid isomerase-like protein
VAAAVDSEFIRRYQEAAREFSRGAPEAMKALFSHEEDVTLANPFGPSVRGWERASEALDFASSRFADGDVEDFEIIAAYGADDLVTMLATERWRARVGDRPGVDDFELRVTTTIRREGDDWRIAHRHADPITTPDAAGPLRGR